jgi:hypothetical protein
MAKVAVPLFQIKITLRDSQHAIWRRFLVASDTKLSQLHDIVQTVMGWQNSHGHMFSVGDVRFTTPFQPDDLIELTAIDARQVRLHHLVAPRRPFTGDFHFAMDYDYDFGDGWSHELIFEDVLDADPKRKAPFCIAGERACPPEDCGGIYGYEALLEALKNPDEPENADQVEWVGEGFDPEKFDVEAVNIALRARI